MARDPPDDRCRRLVGRGLVITAAVTALSAVAGHVGPVLTGRDEITVLEVPVSVSPASFALYGAVTAVTFLATLSLVLWVVSTFDEREDFEDLEEFD